MAITVCGNCIEFGNCTMCAIGTGFNFNGVICSDGFDQIKTQAQGTNCGFSAGGFDLDPTPPTRCRESYEKYPFAADSGGTDVSELAHRTLRSQGTSSSTTAYMAGNAAPQGRCGYQKFPFASGGVATAVSDIFPSDRFGGVQGAFSETHGYITSACSPVDVFEFFEKYPFASDTTAICVGDLAEGLYSGGGVSSFTHGYQINGRRQPGAEQTVIQKWPFASDTNATDVLNSSDARDDIGTSNSAQFGYAHGGDDSGALNVVDKFPFSVDSPATDVGNLLANTRDSSGNSSETHGYSHGGAPPGWPAISTIQKYSFTADGNASDVGEMTDNRTSSSGSLIS